VASTGVAFLVFLLLQIPHHDIVRRTIRDLGARFLTGRASSRI
jgi:hypothetical protein